MQLIRTVIANPNTSEMAYWYQISEDKYNQLKAEKKYQVSVNCLHFKGNQGYNESTYYKDGSMLSYNKKNCFFVTNKKL